MIRFRDVRGKGSVFGVWCILAGCLFLDTPGALASAETGPPITGLIKVVQDSRTQWAVYAFCLSWLILLRVVSVRHASRCATARGEGVWLRGAWLWGLIGWITVLYAIDYPRSARSCEALVLVAGAVIGMTCARAVAPPRWGACPWRTTDGQQRLVDECFPIVWGLLFLLGASALWAPGQSGVYHYRGQVRWQGPWENPNTYGLLMGVGAVLALGMLLRCLCRWQDVLGLAGGGAWRLREGWGVTGRLRSVRWHLCLGDACLTLFIVVSGLVCAFGLLMSYSRGAWLGTFLGVVWLMTSRRSRAGPDDPVGGDVRRAIAFHWPDRAKGRRGIPSEATPALWRRCTELCGQNRVLLGVVLISAMVLSFWLLHQAEQPLVRRVFTVANLNDFSWRNRVAAWEGAMSMIADHPLRGVGWGSYEDRYNQLYRPARVTEGMAVGLNHYLVLGMSAGLPAALLFVGGVVGSMWRRGVDDPPARRDRAGNSSSGSGQCLGRLPTQGPNQMERSRGWTVRSVCQSGAMVLLVGLWFDGGLFRLSTAVPLWMLLELGRGPRGQSLLRAVTIKRGGCVAVQVGLVFLVVWLALGATQARQPFRAVNFSVATPEGRSCQGLTVMPRVGGPFPAVIWSEEWEENGVRHWAVPRQFAELGFAAVVVNAANVEGLEPTEFIVSLLSNRRLAPRVRSEAVVWVGSGIQAPRGEQAASPGGGGLGAVRPEGHPLSASAGWFEHRGRVRALAEHCAEMLNAPTGVVGNVPSSPVFRWIVLVMALGGMGVWGCRRFVQLGEGLSRPLLLVSGVVGGIALADSVLYLGLPHLPATRRTLGWAERHRVRMEELGAFHWLMARVDKPEGGTVGEWVEEVDLATLQRRWAGWRVSEDLWLESVLSPQIIEGSVDVGWRRMLWEHFHPRVRSVTDVEAAATIIVREVARRVWVRRDLETIPPGRTIREVWRSGLVGADDLQRLQVAAMRSCGVPARRSTDGRAQFHDGHNWRAVPGPDFSPCGKKSRLGSCHP